MHHNIYIIDQYPLQSLVTLIADEEKKIVEMYNVWGEKNFMGKTYMGTNRTTFLIDEEGKIKKIITKPDTKNQTQQVLNSWN